MRRILLLLVAAAGCVLAHIDTLSPTETTAGAAGFTLRARGSDLEFTDSLRWNGTQLNTRWINSEELQAFVPASLLVTPGPVTVTLSGYDPESYNPYYPPSPSTTNRGLRFTINAAPVITTLSPLPGAATGASYSRALERTGGTAPFRWSIASGALPAGISLDPATGVLAGTVRADGVFRFTVLLTDREGITATKELALTAGAGASTEPSCAVTPQNMLLTIHHPDAHLAGGPMPQAPDHVVRVTVRNANTGTPVTLSATRPVFVTSAGRTATAAAATASTGMASFVINPPAAEGFDRTDFTASFETGGRTYRCGGSVLVGAGLLSSIRERLAGPAALQTALARLRGQYQTDYKRFLAEAHAIVEQRPELASEAFRIMERYEPALQYLLAGESIRMRSGELAEIDRFLRKLKTHASPAMRTALSGWARDLARADAKVRYEAAASPRWTPAPYTTGAPPSADRASRRLSFEANAGQAGRQVRYVARGAAHRAWFTEDGVILKTPVAGDVKLRFHGAARPLGDPETLEPTGAVTHVLAGSDPAQWRTNIPHYERLRYREVFPGADIEFYGDEGQLRYDFVLRPHANPRRIEVSFDGVSGIEALPSGELALQARQGGTLRLGVPYAYQMRDGRQSPVAARYRSRGGNRIGFELASYDPSLPVVIDPVIAYASYAGGAGEDAALAVTADAQGSAFVAGFSGSGDVQGFVTKFSADGSRILFTTYFGGSGVDIASGIALDAQGNIYVCGSTSSPDFPVASGFRMSYGGGPMDLLGDGFVAKFNAAGSAMLYGSYLGGSGGDAATGIAVNAAGNAFVTGYTASLDFPVRGGVQGANRGGDYMRSDAFAVKVHTAGNALEYATYLGGRGDDTGLAIAIDGAGNAYVTGSTHSADFPAVNAYQTAPGNQSEAFVTKINAAGSALLYSTYLGGSADESGTAIAVDATGAAYIAGITGSPDFPVRNAAQPRPGASNGIGFDAFAAKLAPAGNTLVYSTLLGGSGTEMARGIAVDASGAAYIAGETGSDDFPVSNPLRLAGSGSDSFLSKIDPSGSRLEYSSYLGGQSLDSASAVAVDARGNVYVAGSTASSDHAATPGAASSRLAGRTDAFAIKIAPGATLPLVDPRPATSMRRGSALAPESVATVLGANLAAAGETFVEYPQTTVAGVSVEVTDSAGVARQAAIYSVAPSRIDFVMPEGIAEGAAEIRVKREGTTRATGAARVAPVAPGIFTESGAGDGPPRGWAIRVASDGGESLLPLGQCAGSACEPLELDLSQGTVTLTLLGSGIRGSSSDSSRALVVAGDQAIEAPVASVAPHSEFPGYDQIVVGPLPAAALQNRGIVELVIEAGGERANPVRLRVK